MIKKDAKISIMVIVIAAVLLEANSAIEYLAVRRRFNEQLTLMVQRDLNGTSHIYNTKQEVEAIMNKAVAGFERQIALNNIDSLKPMLDKLTVSNRHIIGSFIVFLPEFVPKEYDYFGNQRLGIYVYESRGDSLEIQSKGFDGLDYTQRPWYIDVMQMGACWSVPYEGLYNSVLMSSYSVPLNNAENRMVAVLSADIPLLELSKVADQFYENQKESALRNLLLHFIGLMLLGFIVWRMVGYLRRLNMAYAEKERFSNELEVAHNIQQSMIPKYSPNDTTRDEMDLYASLTPARAVGGDFYDFLIGEDRLFFCIGDVTGKGVPAALLMTVMRVLFKTEARNALNYSREQLDATNAAATIVRHMNHSFAKEATENYFATMFVGVLNFRTGCLDYCNAGHEAPALLNEALKNKESADQQVQFLNVVPNLPVGALLDWDFEGQTIMLNPGDMLFLYTDGLTEARNEQDELYSRARLSETLKHITNNAPRQMVEEMEAEVHSYAGEAEQSDDLTLMSVLWRGADAVTFPANMEEMPKMKNFMFSVAERAGLQERDTKRLRLVIEEAVANVINYSNATSITLAVDIHDEELMLSVIDDGDPFDPTKATVTDTSIPADQRPPGGMGIILMRQMSDGVAYQRKDKYNMLTIKKYIK